MEFCMRKRRRTYRLADIAAAIFASLLLAVDLMVRDPQPATTSVAQQGDPALVITLIFMALGLCVTFYGLYHERHVLRAHVMRRLESGCASCAAASITIPACVASSACSSV